MQPADIRIFTISTGRAVLPTPPFRPVGKNYPVMPKQVVNAVINELTMPAGFRVSRAKMLSSRGRICRPLLTRPGRGRLIRAFKVKMRISTDLYGQCLKAIVHGPDWAIPATPVCFSQGRGYRCGLDRIGGVRTQKGRRFRRPDGSRCPGSMALEKCPAATDRLSYWR